MPKTSHVKTMDTKLQSGVYYAPHIPVILREVVNATPIKISIPEWVFKYDKSEIYLENEIYVYTSMPDNVRIRLSNIPFKFKLTPWNFMEWIVCQNMQAEIKREIDKDMVELLVSHYK